RQGDFGDVFANVDGEHTCRTHLKPGKPGDAVDAVVVETMDDLSHPLGGTANHLGNDTIVPLADGEHDDAGIATVHGIAPLPFQPAKFNLFVRTKRAYPNSVFHGDTS